MSAIGTQKLRVAKGQDQVLRQRIFAADPRSGEPIYAELAENAITGATSLTVRPLRNALASGDKLLFGENVVLTLSAAAAAGGTTVALVGSALPGPLQAGDQGRKLQDLTGYTVNMEVLTNRGDATAVIALTGTPATQTGDDRGFVDFSLAAADTSGLAAGHYFATSWRRNAGSSRPLTPEGIDFEIFEAGFL